MCVKSATVLQASVKWMKMSLKNCNSFYQLINPSSYNNYLKQKKPLGKILLKMIWRQKLIKSRKKLEIWPLREGTYTERGSKLHSFFPEGTPSLEQHKTVAQRLKRLPPIQETWVRSLGREDPLEKEMVTHSSILAWRIPLMEESGRLQPTGSQRVGHD